MNDWCYIRYDGQKEIFYVSYKYVKNSKATDKVVYIPMYWVLE